MFNFARHQFARQREEEWMDRAGADPADLARSLKFIRRVNGILGYTRATLYHLEQFARNWTRNETIRIVDFATGSADIPQAILSWATRRNFDVRVIGVDLHPITAKIAADQLHDPRFSIVRADALRAPFADGSFDYALTAMFLHHLSEDDAVCVLREMNRVARRGIIAADLLRHRRAYFWISICTLFSSAMVRHDARVSVRQAFSRGEIVGLSQRAGLSYAEYRRAFAHRFVLAGEKLSVSTGGQFER